MSTIKVTNIQSPDSGTNDIIIDASGNVDIGGFSANASAPDNSVNLDSSGRLLVGTSSSAGNGSTIQALGSNAVEVFRYSAPTGNSGPNISLTRSASNTVGTLAAVAATDELGEIRFKGAGNGTTFVNGASIKAAVESGTISGSSLPTRLVFSTTADGASSPTERVRITSLGQFNVFSANNVSTLIGRNSASAGTTVATFVGVHSATDTTNGTISCLIWSNGNIVNTNNSYGSISDAKLKENIVDASSQWDDIKALQVRNYNFIEGQTHTQIGVVAQEVELVSPGLVSESPDRDEEGNDLGTVTKSVNYSVLYMKAVKALQEAMERIETLEAKVNALEGN